MPQCVLPPVSILLLAGGRGSRMGGNDKGLIDWRGKPLIAHLHALVRPLSDDLIISCNRNQPRYRGYADYLVGDAEPDFPGPLAGIRAALAVARYPYLLILPCDAPLVDLALLQALRAIAAQDERPCMVRQAGQWQPLHSILPRRLAPVLESAWEDGERSLRQFLLQHQVEALECAADDPRLANLNTPDMLNTYR